jgi:uncharacterized protein (TIGR03000 family)
MNFAAQAARPAGGFRVGGYRFGSVGGSTYRPYQGGGYNGWHHYPYYGRGAYYPYYGGYGNYYPYYSNPSSSGYSSNDSSYPSSGSGYDSGTAGYDYQSAPSYPYGSLGGSTPVNDQPSDASTSPAQPDNRACVTVTVPASAKVWFDGTATTSTGPERQFVTPPLAQGRQFTYWVRARWNENGREVNQLQPVEVTAGGHFNVRFPEPLRTGG